MERYKEYSAIKNLVDQYFILEEGKKYEDFIKELVNILKI